MTPPDRLRDALRDLADATEPADLYQGSLRRSRRLARRDAAVGTAAAILVLVLLASGLWHLPSGGETPRVAVRSPSASPPGPTASSSAPRYSGQTDAPPRQSMSSGSGTRHHQREPMVAGTSSAPGSRALADLPGRVFYQQAGSTPDVVRMTPADGSTETVLPDAPSAVGISPDGTRIAYVRDGDLLITHTGQGDAAKVAGGVATAAQPPAWSPDGGRLLVDASTPAVLQVDSGTLTPLPDAVRAGRHFRWSGDGSKLVYATAHCGLQVAGSSGVTDKAVPVLGETAPSVNPDGLAACRPTSVDVTGDRVTVALRAAGETGGGTDGGTDGDCSAAADTVVDTVTGSLVPLPVDGRVIGTAFGPDGRLLVRSVRAGKTTLSLFAADGTLLVRAAEPAGLQDLDLLAYTH
jgi:TolB protein